MIFFSRSFEDDPNYFPNWRFLQASEYLKEFETCRTDSPPRTFVVPEEETDELVLDYFSLLTVGDCNDDSVKYAHSCNEHNQIKGFGTTIQAMLVGGCDVDKIAKEMFTHRNNIETYLKIFFDVERYLECDLFISSLISPFKKSDDQFSFQRQNSLWLGISYAFGWEKAKYILQRRLDVRKDVAEIFEEALKDCVNMQAAEFAMAVRAGGLARPADFDRHIALSNATAMSQTMQNENMSSTASGFREALFGLFSEKMAKLPEEHPARAMIADRKLEDSNENLFLETPKKKFGISTLKPL